MEKKRLLRTVLAVIIVAAILIFAIRLISGAVHIVTGAFNAVLCIIVLIVLAAIVVFMFVYAAKRR